MAAAAEFLLAANLGAISNHLSDVPTGEPDEVETYLGGMRKAQLKNKYGWGTGLPRLPRDGCAPERLAQADALRLLGLEKRAQRFEICGRVGELYECADCCLTFKGIWGCSLRSCPDCGKKIFNRAFAELVPLDRGIPASLRSLPGWGWKILDYSFHHDGDFPSQNQMRKMRVAVNRATDRAVREKCRELYLAAKGCRLRFDDAVPVMFEGWPVVSAPDGSARVLEGWSAVQVGGVHKRPTCTSCFSRVKKIKAESARLCPHCGPRQWPDWENQEVDNRHWKLRFGIIHVPVSEFGFDNTNYHFHTCFFGPYLEQSRLVEIFRQESKKALGVESRGVYIQKAHRGFRAALAHALKYTAKLSSSTPERLAKYEQVLIGVRRYSVRGFLQGVQLQEEERGTPKCPSCKNPLKRIKGLGVVPLSEILGIPVLPEYEKDYAREYLDEEAVFPKSGELVVHSPRAPC